ncbi:hypothetical protein QEZ54_19460 [Catellatospora sp. KI3]|uniref:hypothetical protein n=1 Tax=Catellatospora sp. KI3 TaxID=3041620 RepID=UPI002482D4FE|nr:hypothetical protein [Catellatospora sp. KI3]MDI1463161.1 hypothetical protein [Catellatospora sp. KI3]
MRQHLGRLTVLATAAAVSIVAAPGAAHADITTAQPATSTAVAVITADPGANEWAGTTAQDAYATAMARAEAYPDELSMPYLADGVLYSTVTAAASTTVSSLAGNSITVYTSTQPPSTAGDGAEAIEPVDDPYAEVKPPNVESDPNSGDDTLLRSAGRALATPQVVGGTSLYPTKKTVKYSLNALIGPRDEVLALTDLPDSGALRTAFVDAETNRVVVKAAAVTQPLREALATRYGADRIALWLVPGFPTLSGKATRQSDTSPFYGGAYFSTSVGSCSTAFAWTHQGASYILTAGHCTSLNGSAYNPTTGKMGTVTADNWNNTTGSVRVYGQSYYAGDVSTIKMGTNLFSWGNVYRGGSNSSSSRKVTSKWTTLSGLGDQYCVSGQVTGEMCGFRVINRLVNVRYSDGAMLRNATEAYRYGNCTRGGDSGAPIYTIKSDGSVAAKGVLSGGSTNTSGNCYDYFSEIYLAEKSLPGIIKLAY